MKSAIKDVQSSLSNGDDQEQDERPESSALAEGEITGFGD